MNAAQFCAEYARETESGRITFTKRKVFQFIKIYTYFDTEDFTEENIKRLRMYMVDLYGIGFKYQNREDNPVEKIELPKFVI